MNGVTFGNYHSYKDLNLIRIAKEIGSPDIKTKKVEIVGADGSLDYTEYFGSAKYGNRALRFDFNYIRGDFMTAFSNVQDKLHGQKLKITLDEDAGSYYIGRLSVSPFTNEKNIGSISIECDCEPWKYKKDKTTVSAAITGSGTVTLANSRKKVVPTVTTTASMTVAFDGNSYSIGTGSFVLPELELKEGSNTVNVTGTGTITFEYQEGGL
jgi:phage-related protein